MYKVERYIGFGNNSTKGMQGRGVSFFRMKAMNVNRCVKSLLLFALAEAVSLSGTIQAQESALLQEYRAKVTRYNQDMKAAGHAVSLKQNMEKVAKAEFLPSLSAGADFKYTGNPLELSVDLPGYESPLHFQGNDTRYGADLTLAQPLYTGGAIKAGYDKAKTEKEMALHEQERVTNNVLYDADVYYWNCVARKEMVQVAEEFRASVKQLVEVVQQRVEVEYIDRNDLLMAEVKLNDADYQLVQAGNNYEVARMSLNTFAGCSVDDVIALDSLVIPLRKVEAACVSVEEGMALRPELKIAESKVDIQSADAKIANSRYLPNVSLGVNGSYSSPGYDFNSDLDPNYAIYAKVSVPLFEWGKRRNTRNAGKRGVDIAVENRHKVADNIRLEIETARYAYSQAVQKVLLTESSLQKAAESEEMAMNKYREGTVSVVEVINAQLYHQDAKVNYIQSKLNAQIARSGLYRAVGQINK